MAERPVDLRPGDRLAERLRADAARRRPDFSAALHERLCSAVGVHVPAKQPAATSPPLVAPRRWRLRWAYAYAAAAAASVLVLVLAMAIVGAMAWRMAGDRSGPSEYLGDPGGAHAPVARAESPGESLDPAAITAFAVDTTAALGEAFDSAVEIKPWADLDHDARLTWEYLQKTFPPAAANWLAPDASPRMSEAEPPDTG